MRHKWKKEKNEYIIDSQGRKEHLIRNCYECIKCGLKKGNAYHGRSNWYDFVYFKDNKILSKNILPFKCIGNQNSIFLTKEDFEL